jgi:hypothetical protein
MVQASQYFNIQRRTIMWMRGPLQMTSIKVKETQASWLFHVPIFSRPFFLLLPTTMLWHLHFYLHVQCTSDVAYECKLQEEVRLTADYNDNGYLTWSVSHAAQRLDFPINVLSQLSRGSSHSFAMMRHVMGNIRDRLILSSKSYQCKTVYTVHLQDAVAKQVHWQINKAKKKLSWNMTWKLPPFNFIILDKNPVR